MWFILISRKLSHQSKIEIKFNYLDNTRTTDACFITKVLKVLTKNTLKSIVKSRKSTKLWTSRSTINKGLKSQCLTTCPLLNRRQMIILRSKLTRLNNYLLSIALMLMDFGMFNVIQLTILSTISTTSIQSIYREPELLTGKEVWEIEIQYSIRIKHFFEVGKIWPHPSIKVKIPH